MARQRCRTRTPRGRPRRRAGHLRHALTHHDTGGTPQSAAPTLVAKDATGTGSGTTLGLLTFIRRRPRLWARLPSAFACHLPLRRVARVDSGPPTCGSSPPSGAEAVPPASVRRTHGWLVADPAPDDQENTMHAFTRALGASTLAVALGLGAAACGSDAPSVTGAEPSTTDHNDADADFASEMLQHHALALSMVDPTPRPLDPSTPRPRGGRARGADPRRPGAGDRDLHRLAHRVGRGGSRDRALSRQRRSRHG